MDKSDLIDALVNRTGLAPDDAERCIDALFGKEDSIIPRALADGREVTISGFGRFEAGEPPIELRGVLE